MAVRRRRAPWIALFLALGCSAVAAAPDVRVLVDVSGSMKANDPSNLRVPAVELLTRLLPADAHAGVWTFGTDVVARVPLGAVDAHWKAIAERGAASIGSRDQFTDLESGLAAATGDWTAPDPHARRSVIVLTDGVVDVPGGAAASAASRARILGPILERLRAVGASVHAIALSARADRDLLQRLATATHGGFEQVADAATLERVFLHMFERAAPPETLPLEDNRFRVDAAIAEMTLLVFRRPGAADARLVPPGGAPFGKASAPRGVAWRNAGGYDLVTVTKPAPGEWQVLADVDPDNRVMVVTDLRLVVAPLPARATPRERLAVHAHLSEGEHSITRPQFLALLKLTVADERGNGAAATPLALHDDGQGADERAGDGVFSAALPPGRAPGRHRLVVRADGGTFVREFASIVDVAAPPAARAPTTAPAEPAQAAAPATPAASPAAAREEKPAPASGASSHAPAADHAPAAKPPTGLVVPDAVHRPNWTLVIVALAAVNGLVIGLCFAAWWLFFRRGPPAAPGGEAPATA